MGERQYMLDSVGGGGGEEMQVIAMVENPFIARERGVLYRQTANILPSFIYVLGGKSQRNIYQWRENGEWFCQENNTISEVYTNTNVPFVALSTIKAPHIPG